LLDTFEYIRFLVLLYEDTAAPHDRKQANLAVLAEDIDATVNLVGLFLKRAEELALEW
jgi:hypothetical protein